ncbi:MAG TPA: cation-transporting P-type ATPase, partial [Stellaceae bacterium]|nr:cation-transporting P-type ATPase [Stellaceae bacterium]
MTRNRLTPLHTTVPGRVRLRVAGLKRSPATKRALEQALLNIDGVHDWKANPLTGNLTLRFDAALEAGALIARLDAALQSSASPPTSWHGKSVAEVARLLESSVSEGLAPAEALRRRQIHGRNALPHPHARRLLDIMAEEAA